MKYMEPEAYRDIAKNFLKPSVKEVGISMNLSVRSKRN